MITWSEVSRGVPRSPNRHLDHFRVLRQFEIGRLQLQFNGFPDVCERFLFGFASRRATGEFGAHRRVVAGHGIMFQNDSERHSNSIGQRDAADHPNPRSVRRPCPSTRTSPLPHTVWRPTPTHRTARSQGQVPVSIRHWRILVERTNEMIAVVHLLLSRYPGSPVPDGDFREKCPNRFVDATTECLDQATARSGIGL